MVDSKPTIKTSGIVELDDLPEKEVFVELNEKSKKKLKVLIRKMPSISRFLKENKINACFWDWWSGKKSNSIRLDNFKKISNALCFKDFEIEALKGKAAISIEKPKPFFDFTTRSGVKFIASILGDGHVHKKGIRYYNKNRKLINNFIKYSNAVFGNVRVRINKGKNEVLIVNLPTICRKTIECVGIMPGSKITNKTRIPEYVFSLKEERVFDFVSSLIDDDGWINNGRIMMDMAFEASEEPWLLYDLQNLLKIFGIDSCLFPIRKYESKHGPKRKMWRLGIFSYKNAEKFCSKTNLESKEKLFRSEKILLCKRRELYRGDTTYFIKMKEIIKQRGSFNVIELANATNRSVRHSRRIVLKLKRFGKIRVLEPSYSSKTNPSIERYVIS